VDRESPRHRRRWRPERWLAAALVLVAIAALAFYYGQATNSTPATPSTSQATAGRGAVSAAVATSAAPTTTARPPARLVGILITKNVGPGEKQGQANRVYLLGRHVKVATKQGPKLRIDLAPLQPVDVDPRDNVYRIIRVPVRQILDHPSLSWQPAPQLVVHPGERVKVIVQNRDRIEHSFTFEQGRVSEDNIFSGTTKTVEFTVPRRPPPKDHPYQYYCRWRALGMDGPFVVQPK
jgi:hypothetical protein